MTGNTATWKNRFAVVRSLSCLFWTSTIALFTSMSTMFISWWTVHGEFPSSMQRYNEPQIPSLHHMTRAHMDCLSLLFRPHRNIATLVKMCLERGREHQRNVTETPVPMPLLDAATKKTSDNALLGMSDDNAWNVMYEKYLPWKNEDIDAVAAPYFRKDKSVDMVAPCLCNDPTDARHIAWWACMISEKLRNYETAMRRHKENMFAKPPNLSNLPDYGIATVGQPDEDVRCDVSDVSAEAADPHGCNHDGDDHAKEALQLEPNRRAPATDVPVSVHCGETSEGHSLEEFNNPPAKVHIRNAEGRYWSDFGACMQRTKRMEEHSDVTLASQPSWTLKPHDAVEAAERQKEFFKSVNSFQRDDVDTSYCKPKETELDKK